MPAGAVVAPLEWHHLAHELISRRPTAARLELEPLAEHFREALRWRLSRLMPIVVSPTYRPLWQDASKGRRLAALEAIFQSGDFHYGTSRRELRQKLAVWLHARLTVTVEGDAPS